MIWTLILIIGIALGIVLIRVSYRARALYFDTRINKYDTIGYVCSVLGVSMILLNSAVLSLCIIGIIMAHTYSGKSDVLAMKERHDALVAAQQEETPITVQNQLYADIAKYNSDLRNQKHWANSLWTNWMYSKGYNDLEYIKY